MKYLVILFLAISCNQKETSTLLPEKAAINTENEVTTPPEGCACIKIFRPVCVDGRTYGNSCEAECNGHKEWSEGSCNEVK